jgi:hypothetical protein
VQFDPMKPKLTPPRTKRLKLNCDTLLSTSAFKFDLRCYNEARGWPNTCYGVSKMGIIALTRVLARAEPTVMARGFIQTKHSTTLDLSALEARIYDYSTV